MLINATDPTVATAVEPMPNASAPPDEDGFGFDDLLDIVNPLQHIPLIGTLYRELTGDKIELPARLAGGALFGGLVGFLSSAGMAVFEEIAGESVDEIMLGLFDERPADPVQAQRAYRAAYSLID